MRIMLISYLEIQKLDVDKSWTELLFVAYRDIESIPFIILKKDDADRLRSLEGQKIRFRILETDDNKIVEDRKPVKYHCWDIRKWKVSNIDFIIPSPLKRYVNYYTEEIKDGIETP